MEEKSKKFNFFSRMKIAIFKLEEYGTFLGEKLSKSFKYFFLLILLMTVIIVLASSYDFYKMMNKVYNYITNELPEFSYNDGNLEFSNNVEAYDNDYDFRLFVNTNNEVSDEELTKYKNDIYSSNDGLILLKDKVIYMSASQTIEKTYEEIESTYNLQITNKQELLDNINQVGINNLIVIYFGSSLVVMFVDNVITILADLCLVAVFGYIASMICGVRFKIAPMITLSIYSLTLSIVLSCIYNVSYIFTGFVIKYFNVMYLLIAYVYIVAAIFMIKYDLIKQTEELQKIIEVQKQVRKEAEESDKNQEENNEEKDHKEEKKEDDKPVKNEDKPEENKEPDGSEI